MFSIKEIVRLVENELILLNQFEWRAVVVLFLQTFNPKLENNVRPYFNFICTQTVRTLDTMQKKYEQTSCLQYFLETTVELFNCLQ